MKKIFLPFFFLIPFFIVAQSQFEINIDVVVHKNLRESFSPVGRLIVFFSKNEKPAPVFQSSFSSDRFGFAINLQNWDLNSPVNINSDNCFSSADTDLKRMKEGTWFVQAVYNISGKPEFTAFGNLYSKPIKIKIDKNQTVLIELSEKIQSVGKSVPSDTQMVKYVEIESKLLSDFWGKPMKIKASVLLPKQFKKDNGKKYPIRINIGGYGSSWTRASRLEKDSAFMEWWLSDASPEILNIFPDGDGPFGDPYYIDSDNSGPYGSALTQELVPFIEKQFNGMNDPKFRFVDGCSTGGWVSFALQVFYPDYFNGAWSFSADPVDFNNMQLVNMYKDKSAFFNQFGYLTPSARSKTGQPKISIKDEVAGENIQSFDNSYISSGGQWGAWNALYSPKGINGLPVAAFDPITGEINQAALEHWKKYDLLDVLKTNWPVLGPKLQGKLWIWMGDMDQFYLNNAMREMDAFLKSTSNPKSDAQIIFEPTKGHCEEFDHRWVLEMMQEKVKNISSK